MIQSAGTNSITWSLCRQCPRVRTQLQVIALEWVLLHRVLLHSPVGVLSRASSRSRSSQVLHRRRGTHGRRRGSQGRLSSPRSRGTRGRRRGSPGRLSSLSCSSSATGSTRGSSRSSRGVGLRGRMLRGARGPKGTAPRARYLLFLTLELVVPRRTCLAHVGLVWMHLELYARLGTCDMDLYA